MGTNVVFELNPHPNDIEVLGNGIMEYAKQEKSLEPIKSFGFFIRDDNNKIQAGCNGIILYGSLYIDQLWVAESLRHQGCGKKLMVSAEQFGIEKHCTFSTVNTMDWEAIDFYKKLGYQVEFERRGFDKDSIFYFLRKSLVNERKGDE